MDLSNSTVKTPETEIETPTRIQPAKPQPTTNGVLKRHAPLNLHLLNHHHHPVVVTYKECQKNHAATLGGHALDGCGEFMPSPAFNPTDPTSLKCAACGCHRNFHRRDPEEPPLQPNTNTNTITALEFHTNHRHQPNPPRGGSPNNSPSPPPISSSFYPSAPHMLMALSTGLSGSGLVPHHDSNPNNINNSIGIASPPIFSTSSGRKRFRTKFTQNQKDKMLELAERLGWKMQKRDEDVINECCGEIGVDKGVFKVWMHNNKNNFGKKDQNMAISTPPPPPPPVNSNGVNLGYSNEGNSCEIKENVNASSSSS